MRINLYKLRVWDQLQNSDIPPPKEDLAKWEAEFNQLMTSQRDDLDYDFGAAMQDTFQTVDQGEFKDKSSLRRFDDEGLPILSPYVFGTYSLFSCL
jgi:peroxin-5